MATLTQKSTLASDTTFQSQVRASMIKAALDIVGENNTTPNSSQRQILGYKVLQGAYRIDVWANAVVMQADISVADDTSINNAISAIWNDMAGVTTA